MTRRRINTPSQAVARHFAHVPINTHALAAAKEKALRSRARLAKYPGKGGPK